MELPRIPVIRKNGEEPFLGMPKEHTLLDFWIWAFSDLISNTERGKLAEYLVAMAIGCDTCTSQTWDSYDLLSPEGIKVEVKTSAYIQSWDQKGFSTLSFGIAETQYWDGLAYEGEKKRQADVYVFCVLKHKEQETINPLDLAQWDFYPVATHRLNSVFGKQKHVSLGMLISRCGSAPCSFSALQQTIRDEYQSGRAVRK